MRIAIAHCLLFAVAACAAAPAVDAPIDNGLTETMPSDTRRDPRCEGAVETYPPGRDMIANSAGAERIALAYFATRFPDVQRNGRPLSIELKDGVWHVFETVEPGAAGGGMNAALCRSNGRVLALYVTQ